MFCEAFGEEIVGKFPCLLESIVNFKVDLSIVLVVCEKLDMSKHAKQTSSVERVLLRRS
jgi:hypothetical protein